MTKEQQRRIAEWREDYARTKAHIPYWETSEEAFIQRRMQNCPLFVQHDYQPARQSCPATVSPTHGGTKTMNRHSATAQWEAAVNDAMARKGCTRQKAAQEIIHTNKRLHLQYLIEKNEKAGHAHAVADLRRQLAELVT